MILKYSIIVFFTQLIFIGTRTWNVRAVSSGDLKKVLISGTIVHLSWLMGIAIGTVSMAEILKNMSFEYLPVILSSLSGSLIGSYFGMIKKR